MSKLKEVSENIVIMAGILVCLASATILAGQMIKQAQHQCYGFMLEQATLGHYAW